MECVAYFDVVVAVVAVAPLLDRIPVVNVDDCHNLVFPLLPIVVDDNIVVFVPSMLDIDPNLKAMVVVVVVVVVLMLAAHELTKKTKKKKKQLLTLLLNLYQHLRQKSFLFLLIMVY
jgi:hypothetical protein